MYFQQLAPVSADWQLSHSYVWVGFRSQVWTSGSISFAKGSLHWCFVSVRVFVLHFSFFSYCVFVPFSLEESAYAAGKMLSDL